jgi:hypothetical protein
MDVLEQNDLQQLLEISGKWCISLYMPAHRIGREQQQDPVRLGNLITQAKGKLLAYGIRRPEGLALMRPAENLLEGQSDFWQHQSDGLAIFLADGFFKVLRLPLIFEELVIVANNFHLKPLLPLLSKDNKFYILAISMDEIRLLLGTDDTVDQVDLGDVPTSMQEALWMDDPEEFTGFHTRTSPTAQGERQAMFHGHGSKADEDKTNLLRFFQYVDAGLNSFLNEKDIPMVLAGVEYLHPIYREANTYPNLLEEGLEGNPEELSAKELRDSAWKIVQPIFEAAHVRDVERFKQFYGQQNDLASDDLQAVVKAAHFGQVETLFVARDVQRWGRYDPQENQVILDTNSEQENEDLLDYAAKQTLLNSGQVYAVPSEKIPGRGDVAAILRYTA